MEEHEFIARGEEISRRAGQLEQLHGYFLASAPRLHQCCELFGLFSQPLGRVLEIGPFYGYVPFLLRPKAEAYTVLEGDDPAVYPLRPLYAEAGIEFTCVDLFEIFGPVATASRRFPFEDESFETILCWETMEHFNFNPASFVRELHRLLRPGGRVCITVPNRASFQHLFDLIFGRGERHGVNLFFQFENYESNGKKAFYGFHWHEYTTGELALLFAGAGFKVEECGSFVAFQHRPKMGLIRRAARFLSVWGARLLPRYGVNAYLTATKAPAGTPSGAV